MAACTIDNGRKTPTMAATSGDEAMVARIESMPSVVIEIDEATVGGQRDSSGDAGVVRGGRPA
jgi:hypothetical protein